MVLFFFFFVIELMLEDGINELWIKVICDWINDKD